jgi:hypothetical protein
MLLRETQRAMRDTIIIGPSALHEALFAGSIDDVVRGLKVHANTISYARLTSLEETFPRTRDRAGHAVFNGLSRDYIESGHGVNSALSAIGEEFPAWLATRGIDSTLVALAAFENCWLSAYHAADVEPFALSIFSGKSEDQILGIVIARHPAARLVANEHGLDEALGLDTVAQKPAILITRPDAAVTITGLSKTEAMVFETCTHTITLRALLTTAIDHGDDGLLFAALTTLIEAGAFMLSGENS